MVENCKTHNVSAFLHFQETLSLDFLEVKVSSFCERSCLGKGLFVKL